MGLINQESLVHYFLTSRFCHFLSLLSSWDSTCLCFSLFDSILYPLHSSVPFFLSALTEFFIGAAFGSPVSFSVVSSLLLNLFNVLNWVKIEKLSYKILFIGYDSVSFDKCILPCNYSRDMEQSYSPPHPLFPGASLWATSLPHSDRLATADLCSVPIVLPFPECRLNEIRQYGFFPFTKCTWYSSTLHVTIVSSLFIAE